MIHALPKANVEQTNRSIFGCKFLLSVFFVRNADVFSSNGFMVPFWSGHFFLEVVPCWLDITVVEEVAVAMFLCHASKIHFSMGVAPLCQEGWQGRGSRNVSCLHCQRRSSYLWRVMFCLFSTASRSTWQSLFEKHENRCSEVEGSPVGNVIVI